MSILDTKIYILAAGKQSRFPNTYKPKQLLVINNETILERQLRQCSEYQIVPTVITHNTLIQNQSPKFIHPDNNTTILHSMHSSLPWEKYTIFLLGDVFYSKTLFKNIITNTQSPKFWMSGSEIFALSFQKKDNQLIQEKLEICLQNINLPKVLQLWHLYRVLNNQTPMIHQIYPGPIVGDLVTDYTFDIDSLQQYKDVSKFIDVLKKTIPNP
jgi:hypothetical protein